MELQHFPCSAQRRSRFSDFIVAAAAGKANLPTSCVAAGGPKMRSARLAVAVLAVSALLPGAPRAIAADGFDLVVLGALGGIQDGNLSASLIHPHGDDRAVTCDAGTLVNGLRVAEEKGAFAAIGLQGDTDQWRES